MAGALIVTAELVARDFAWLDPLRRKHFPVERNQLSAHLTMFHALPPSAEGEARTTLGRLASRSAPHASLDGLMNLGGGVAFRVVSPELDAIRRELSEDFHGLLSAQDSGGWRPHITVQNKVLPSEARATIVKLTADYRPQPLGISGLGLHRYLGSPWEMLMIWKFRGV